MDLRFGAAPHGFSQLYASFFAVPYLGIHRVLLLPSYIHSISALRSCRMVFRVVVLLHDA